MATYHCSIKNDKNFITRNGTRNGFNHSLYICREGKYENKKAEELIYKEHSELPSWANTPHDFFKASEENERANAASYYEIEVALPNELSIEDNIKIVKNIIKENIGNNKIWSFAIHDKDAGFTSRTKQIHAHIMFSERIAKKNNTKNKTLFFKRYNVKYPERGGYKKDDRFTKSYATGKENFKKIRQSCQNIINSYYEKNNMNLKVDCRNLKEQMKEAVYNKQYKLAEKLDRLPQKHMGNSLIEKVKREEKKYKDKQYYYLKIAPYKVRYAYLQRLKREIEQAEKNTIKHQESLNQQVKIADKLKEKVTEMDQSVMGFEVIRALENYINALALQYKNNQVLIKKLQKNVYTEEQAKNYALSIFTSKSSKNILEEKRNLDKLKAEFKIKNDIFNLTEEPKLYDIANKKKYYQQKNELESLKDRIEKVEKILNPKLLELKTMLKTEKTKLQIEQIKELILKKSAVYAKQIEDLKDTNKKLQENKEYIFDIKKTISKKYYAQKLQFDIDQIKIKKSAAHETERNNKEFAGNRINDRIITVNDVDKVTKDLQNAIYLAKEARVKGGIKAKILKENDNEYEY